DHPRRRRGGLSRRVAGVARVAGDDREGGPGRPPWPAAGWVGCRCRGVGGAGALGQSLAGNDVGAASVGEGQDLTAHSAAGRGDDDAGETEGFAVDEWLGIGGEDARWLRRGGGA